jgi:hypothetical protein
MASHAILSTALKIESDFQSAADLLCLVQYHRKNWGPLAETADRPIRVSPGFSPGN